MKNKLISYISLMLIFLLLSSSIGLAQWIQKIGNEVGNPPSGFGVSSNLATRGIEIFDGELYVGTQNLDANKIRILPLRIILTTVIFIYRILDKIGNIGLLTRLANTLIGLHGIACDGCELWKYNNTLDEWTPLVSDAPGSVFPAGFGNRGNFATAIIQSFKDKLYVGTATSSLEGCEIWRYNGVYWKKVVEKGLGDRHNSGAWTSTEYNDELYVGTMNWKTGCQVWKTSDGNNWMKVDIPGGDGFGTHTNIYVWAMNVYKDTLFVGTCNIHPTGGCELWSYDGNNWKKIDLPGGDGFGDPVNYGIRNMINYYDEMYISTGTNILQTDQACEIWKYDGNKWTNIIGENGVLSDGFGNIYNKYGWSMMNSSDGKLWVGTWNSQPLIDGIPFSSKGCELWCYDGDTWRIIVGEGDDAEHPGGFGNMYNCGARSIMEYPEGSGTIWIGTLTMDVETLRTFKGCEIWRRA